MNENVVKNSIKYRIFMVNNCQNHLYKTISKNKVLILNSENKINALLEKRRKKRSNI